MKGPSWLRDAVFYEIYPQSFLDTNGDGIGDLPGIIQKLDYIKELGCNALWINPCFDSPFKDAGYDVRDYFQVAPRYGTNEDLCKLFDEAHARGMHVFLDLVPGHTSEEHAWFKESSRAEKNALSGRYIWTDFWIRGIANHPYIGGECERNGTYMLNFFKSQPALNYGWKTKTEKWQSAMESPDALATREAIREVMRFWLSKGCDGFRVDMADSLVKDDDNQKSGTCEVWRDLLGSMRKEFPEAAFVAEWSCPWQALSSAGFDMDFYLDHQGNGYNTLLREHEMREDSPFAGSSGADEDTASEVRNEELTAPMSKEDVKSAGNSEKDVFEKCKDPLSECSRPEEKHEAIDLHECTGGNGDIARNEMIGCIRDDSFFLRSGHGDITRFTEDYLHRYLDTKEDGYISFMTCNHDTPRLAPRLTIRELKLAYAFLFTMPGVPFLYYGDEIGMKYRPELPTKEGGYTRTGTRTPMQWNHSENLGFSSAEASRLYLPVDPAEDAPTVEDALQDSDSLLHTVREVLHLRHAHPSLQADGPFEVVFAESGRLPFVYRRGEFLFAVNPSGEEQRVELPIFSEKVYESCYTIGEAGIKENTLCAGPQSFAIYQTV